MQKSFKHRTILPFSCTQIPLFWRKVRTGGNLEIWDVIFLGGGLASGLSAYRLRQLQPHLKILVIERENHLGGNHTWCFHGSDLTSQELHWIAPFITKVWG